MQATDTAAAVRAEGLSKRYGTLVAVDAISLEVACGEVYGLLGPNGAGKTTLLRMLFGLVRPDAGTLELFGRSWARDGVATLDGVGGFVESPRFYPYLSGRRNLELLGRLDGGADPSRIDEVLDTVELTTRAGDRVGGYSFGMRQRLGLAASLLRAPKLIVLDEPTNGLDPAGIRDMRALLRRLRDGSITVLLSSHDLTEVEEICDNVTVMRTGTVAYHGSIEALRRRAPDTARRLRTADDVAAVSLAAAVADVVVTPLDDGLAVRGPQDAIDRYLLRLVTNGVPLRELAEATAPLEELFFQLTERPDRQIPA